MSKLIPVNYSVILKSFFGLHLQGRKDIPNTGYNRPFKFLKELIFKTPKSDEQRAIAAVLSDMDAEIATLEQRRDKTIAIKQGMMQQLLTGRVRLSESRSIADDTDDAD